MRCGLPRRSRDLPQKRAGEPRGHRQNQWGTGDLRFQRLEAAEIYAVAAFHAAGDETQMQYGMFGKPKEGYGFSRNPPARTGAPAFASAAFDLGSAARSAPITLSY